MTAQDLLEKLKERDIILSVDGDNITARGELTEDTVKQIRFYKPGLLQLLKEQPFMIIDYNRSFLFGQLPKHYTDLGNGKIRAIYRNRQELVEHILAACWVKEEFEQADDVIKACEALGGVVGQVESEPVQGKLID